MNNEVLSKVINGAKQNQTFGQEGLNNYIGNYNIYLDYILESIDAIKYLPPTYNHQLCNLFKETLAETNSYDIGTYTNAMARAIIEAKKGAPDQSKSFNRFLSEIYDESSSLVQGITRCLSYMKECVAEIVNFSGYLIDFSQGSNGREYLEPQESLLTRVCSQESECPSGILTLKNTIPEPTTYPYDNNVSTNLQQIFLNTYESTASYNADTYIYELAKYIMNEIKEQSPSDISDKMSESGLESLFEEVLGKNYIEFLSSSLGMIKESQIQEIEKAGYQAFLSNGSDEASFSIDKSLIDEVIIPFDVVDYNTLKEWMANNMHKKN